MKIIFIIVFSLFLFINANNPIINLSSNLKSGDYFTVEENNIIIKTYSSRYIDIYIGNNRIFSDLSQTNRFLITGTNVDKTIIIPVNCVIYLDSIILTSKETPIVIEKGITVELILFGKSSLINSALSENMGNIYLKEGAKLIISGPGTLNLPVNNFYGIYGEKSSSLVIKDATLNIISTENFVGAIYTEGDITFNNPKFHYDDISGEYPVISTKQSIIINSGNFDILSNGTIFYSMDSIIINSGNLNLISEGTIFDTKNSIIINDGTIKLDTKAETAIKAENSIYIKGGDIKINSSNGTGIRAQQEIFLGAKDEDMNSLKLNINSLENGMEAQRIEIFSGKINIESNMDGIKILDDSCKQDLIYRNRTCYIKIYGGDILINSNRNGINSMGNIYVAGGKTILYAGKNYQPIAECKLLKITKGLFFAGGSKGIEQEITETTQMFSINNKTLEKGSIINIYDISELISDIRLKKDIDYFYINYPSNYNLKINETINETNIRILKSIDITDNDKYSSENIQNNLNSNQNSEDNEYSDKIKKGEQIDNSENSEKSNYINKSEFTDNIGNSENIIQQVQKSNFPNQSSKEQNLKTNIIENKNNDGSLNTDESKDITVPNNPNQNNENNETNDSNNLDGNENSQNLSHFLNFGKAIILCYILIMFIQ